MQSAVSEGMQAERRIDIQAIEISSAGKFYQKSLNFELRSFLGFYFINKNTLQKAIFLIKLFVFNFIQYI